MGKCHEESPRNGRGKRKRKRKVDGLLCLLAIYDGCWCAREVDGRWMDTFLARLHPPFVGYENTQLLQDVYHMQIVAVAMCFCRFLELI